MVVKLVGKINSQTVIFERTKGDWWEAAIPSVPSGVYIVELTAVDDAGNKGFCTRYIMTVDLTALRVTLETYPYEAVLIPQDFYITILVEEYRERNGMNVTFDFGETKHVRIEVLSRNNEPFEIFDAAYELVSEGGEVEDSGIAVINEHVLDVLLEPKKTGMYKLRFIYHIGDQTLIEELNMVVV